ncbi:hypothetical protein REPUB_Repub02eG0279500 [Reevesia pubescens]
MTGARGKASGKNTAEALKPTDDRKVGKRKASVDRGKAKKEKRAKKDPNKPKRPSSTFFVFLEEFRTTFKKENPNVKAVSAEKGPYEAKAEKRKADYEKQMKIYNKKQESSANGMGDDDDGDELNEEQLASEEEGQHQQDDDEEEEDEDED